MASKRDELLDNYYRTTLLMPDISEIGVDEYKYTVRNGHIILNYIEDSEVVKQAYYKIADGFDIIIADTFMSYEFKHIFDTLDIGDVKQIGAYAFSYIGVRNLIGDSLVVLEDNSLTKIQNLNTIYFKNLERFSLYTFHNMEDYQDVCYAKLGNLELRTKEECSDFFSNIQNLAMEIEGDTWMRPEKSYIDTTRNEVSYELVARGRPYIG